MIFDKIANKWNSFFPPLSLMYYFCRSSSFFICQCSLQKKHLLYGNVKEIVNCAKLLKVCNSKYILNYLALGYSNKILASAKDVKYINIKYCIFSGIQYLCVYPKVR